MHEISGAIIAITLVMTAVFIPVTFMPGPVGVFYRQFGLTMAMSIVLSGVVALTLTPVLCAMILKPHAHGHANHAKKRRGLLAICCIVSAGCGLGVIIGVSFVGAGRLPAHSAALLQRPFDRAVEKVTGGYAGILRRIVTRRVLTMLVIGGFGVGIFVVNTQLADRLHPARGPGHHLRDHPDASGLDARVHQRQVPRAAGDLPRSIDEVTSVSSLAGYEVLTEGRGSNAGTCIINLKPWADRKLTSQQIIEELEEKVPQDCQCQARVLRAARGSRASARPAGSPCVCSTRRTRPTTSGSEK